MSERDFWESSLGKIVKLIDIYADEKNIEADEDYESRYFQQPVISSMKDLEGFGSGESV